MLLGFKDELAGFGAKEALDALSSHIAVLDDTGTIVFVNKAWRRFAEENGARPDSVSEGVNYLDVCVQSAASGALTAGVVAHCLQRVIAGDEVLTQTRYACHSPTEDRWFRLQIRQFIIAHTRYVMVSHDDVTDQEKAEDALRNSEKRLQLALKAGRMYAWERDPQSNWVIRSEGACDLIGFGSGPLEDFMARVEPVHHDQQEPLLEPTIDDRTSREHRYLHPDGHHVWLAARSEEFATAKGDRRILGVTFDISEQKAAEDRIWREANLDPLTGLPNRKHFNRCLSEAVDNAISRQTTLSLLLIDIDDFKDINDTLGHDAGDFVVNEIGRRLASKLRSEDVVARLGGDEFAALIGEPLSFSHAVDLADYLLTAIRAPITYNGRHLEVRASIGVAAVPDHSRSPSNLTKFADVALYRAKAEGRNRAVPFVPEMMHEIERRVAVRKSVAEALDEDRIVPFYQPRISLENGDIVAFEALARWVHPTKGVLSAGSFATAFDDNDLAERIGEIMLHKIIADMRSWRSRGINPSKVALNLSSAEFHRAHLAEPILKALQNAEIPLSTFEVEVTEGVLLGRNAERVRSTLTTLADAGIAVAFDDFGTGFASLTHLKQFPVSHIKIDRSFVQNLENSVHDQAIVRAIAHLGRSLDMRVTAEGVETTHQVEILRAVGCTSAQGFLYAKPMAATRVPWFIDNWRGRLDSNSRRIAPKIG